MTDQPKWTPGPWKACHDGKCSCGQVWSIPADHPVASATETPWGDRYHVAAPTVDDPKAVTTEFLEYGSFPEEEFHANAHLIAAAPDLYAALEAAMAFIESHVADPDITDEMIRNYRALQDLKPRDVLAKARGQA